MVEPAAPAERAKTERASFLLEGIQQAYWVGQGAELDLSTPATYYVEVDVPGELKTELTPALQQLLRRHDMLRAVILPSGEQQVLDDVGPYEIEILDLRDLPATRRRERLETLRTEINTEALPTDLWPQFDIRATQDEAGLRLHMRFALWMMDGWSFHLLLREWLALCADPASALPPIEMSFADYVEAQGLVRQGPRWRAAWDYWQPRLGDFPGPPSLPLTSRLSLDRRPRFRHVSRTMSAQHWAKIVDICARLRIPPSLLACAVYTEVLSRYAGSGHFAITVLYSGRFQHLPRATQTFGNFGTTILLEVDASRDRSFVERVRGLQRQFWRDAERIEVSGIDISRAMQQRAGTGPGMSVPVTFTAVTGPAGPEATGNPTARIDHDTARLQVPQVYLDHQMHFGDDGSVIFNWDYVEQIFPAGFVEELCRAHRDLFLSLARDEALWNERDPKPYKPAPPTPATAPSAAPERLEAAFERQAADRPENVAVIAGDRRLTYAQLRRLAVATAGELSRRGVARGDLVAVSLPKGWEQIVAVLGILYAGAAYVPVDPDLPAERRNVLFSQSKARFVLTRTPLEKALAWPAGLQRICVDLVRDDGQDVPPPAEAMATDLAYVIFTSGSTGVPKGVMIDHRGAWNTIVDLNSRFSLQPADRILALSSLSFDLSVYDIFGTLAAGATIVVPDAERAKEASHWRDLVQRHDVTVWNSVPALMQLAVEGAGGAVMPSLRLVMLSGDWIPLTLPEQIRPAAPAAEIWSLGGATEASIWSVLYPIGRIDPEWRSIPYGHAMDHQSIQVLDADLAVCPPWVPGDLYIGGIGVALGYLGDQAKTAASFIRHPTTGERLYRTGDMGRYLADGEIEFLGRKDFQVKIQGYRVECAEVEAALLAVPEVAAAVVVAVTDGAGTRHLAGYVVPKAAGAPLDPAGLRERLRAILPAYMVPTYFVSLDRLPLSDNGKVVRSALPAPDFGVREATKRSPAPPKDALEEAIAALWRDTLGTDEVGREDDFFALGGSSFAGMRLMAKLEERFKRRFSFATLVSYPTVASIADLLRGDGDEQADAILTPIRHGREGPALFCVHPIGGNVMCYVGLAQALRPGRAVYGLRAPGLTCATQAPLDSIEDMAVRYLEEIRAVQPDGPYHLIGWSLGGLVVQEMARRLEAGHETPGLVAMIDSAAPDAPVAGAAVDPAERFAGFVNDLAAVAKLPLACTKEELTPLSADERIAWLTERMERHGVPTNAVAMKAVYGVFSAGSMALDKHTPRAFGGRLLLFAATQRPDARCMQEDWRATVPEIEIIEMDADHYSIMQPPLIDEIASTITRAMAAAEAERAQSETGARTASSRPVAQLRASQQA
ncbi:MAG: amino acid adenylation domain-containing protein [Nitratireductor sp.]|uniref:non-ribosomal peptide synthetase n=2 Tax=Pseudomonadota TaxID=1224 RepID=UPI003280226A